MSQNKLKQFIRKLVREYTGTGSSGGNAGDGNSIPSPRPFTNDVEEIENYIFKNVYGGDGGQWTGDKASYPNPNRTRFGLMEEDEDEIRNYIKNEIRKYYGQHDYYGNNVGGKSSISGYPGVWENLNEQMDAEKQQYYADLKIKLQKRLANVDIDITREQLKAISAQATQASNQVSQQISQIEQQIADMLGTKEGQEKGISSLRRELDNIEADDELPLDVRNKRREEISKELQKSEQSLKSSEDKFTQLKKQKEQLFQQQSTIMGQASSQKTQVNQQITKLKKAMNSIGKKQTGQQAIQEYFKDTKSNLMKRMDSYRKEAKRSVLMEGAMKAFFEKFNNGMTDEEIIQDYASSGTQVPEQFVSNARKQYENYSKLKLELEMSEKEFKNSAKEIVNNPEENTTEQDSDSKQLASGLFKEEILKKQIVKELNKIK